MSRTKQLLEDYHFHYPELDDLYGDEYHSAIIEIHEQMYKEFENNPLEDEVKLCNLVFVYGTLMDGCGNHGRLQHSKCLGKAKTVSKYIMTGSGIPFVSKKIPMHHILGEVYEIDATTLESLDWLEGHPTNYCREIINVIVNEEEKQAWLYFYESERNNGQVIENGDYRTYCKNQKWY